MWGGLKGKQKAKWLWLCIVIDVICLIYCFGPFDLPAQWGIIFFMIPDYMYVFLAGCAVYYLNYTENLQQKGMMILYLFICTVVCKCLCSESSFIFFIFSLCMLILCSREKTNQKTEGMKQIIRPFIFLSEISAVFLTEVSAVQIPYAPRFGSAAPFPPISLLLSRRRLPDHLPSHL